MYFQVKQLHYNNSNEQEEATMRSTESMTMNFSSESMRIVISGCVYFVIWLHSHAPQVFFDRTYNHRATEILFVTGAVVLPEVFHSFIRAIVHKIKPTVIKSVDKSLILRWLTSALYYFAAGIVLHSKKFNMYEACESVLWVLCSSVINHYTTNTPHQTVWDISLTLLTIASSGVIMLLFPFCHNIQNLYIYQPYYQLFIYFWITIQTILLYSTRETLRQVTQSRDNLINDRIRNSQ